jgi:hypothetical protein
MRRHLSVGGLLLVSVAVLLGATVFRTDVVQAAAAVMNVREQNLDANGNIMVHEQGTAQVRLRPTNAMGQCITTGADRECDFGRTINASLIVVQTEYVGQMVFFNGTASALSLYGPPFGGQRYYVLPLTQPIPVSRVQMFSCSPLCDAYVSVAGTAVGGD